MLTKSTYQNINISVKPIQVSDRNLSTFVETVVLLNKITKTLHLLNTAVK